MNFSKLGFATLLLLACACDKPDDKMQSAAAMTSASSMATTNMAPTMAPSSMAPSMASAGAMTGPHDMGMMGMAGDGGTMMNNKPPKMSASATHM
jgi:hypothetical protein